MYEVGKERSDGKFNVWRSVEGRWEIVDIFADWDEALEYATYKNQSKRQKTLYKVNQGKL